MSTTEFSNNMHVNESLLEKDFKQQLKSLSRPGIFNGHLVVLENGSLARTNLICILWEKIKGIFNFRNGANPYLTEIKVLEFLSKGKKWIHSPHEIRRAQAIAKKVFTSSKNHNELHQLIARISHPLVQGKKVKTSEEDLAIAFFERHKNRLKPYEKELSSYFNKNQQDSLLPQENLCIKTEEINTQTPCVEISSTPTPVPLDEPQIIDPFNPLTPSSLSQTPNENHPIPPGKRFTFKTFCMVGIIATGIFLTLKALTLFQPERSTYNLDMLNIREQKELKNLLLPVCHQAVQNFCKPSGKNLCLKDYLRPDWKPQIKLEDQSHIVCDAEIVSPNCEEIVAQTCTTCDPPVVLGPRFKNNFEEIKADISFLPWRLKQALTANQDYYKAENNQVVFKSHIECFKEYEVPLRKSLKNHTCSRVAFYTGKKGFFS